MIGSGSRWLLAACALLLCLAAPAPCAAASSADLAAPLPSLGLEQDLPEILILKPPPPPPCGI